MAALIGLEVRSRAFAITQLPLMCRACHTRFVVPVEKLKSSNPKCPRCGATDNHESTNSALKRAVEFLLDILALEPVAATEIFRQARRLKISSITLRRAAMKLGVKSMKCGGTYGGDPRWRWSLSEDDHRITFDHLQRKRFTRACEKHWRKALARFTPEQREKYEAILKERPKWARRDPEYQAAAVEAVILGEDQC